MMTSYIVGIGCSFVLAAIVSFFWVRGIDYMHKNHPDYTGDDLFGFDENKKENNEK